MSEPSVREDLSDAGSVSVSAPPDVDTLVGGPPSAAAGPPPA